MSDSPKKSVSNDNAPKSTPDKKKSSSTKKSSKKTVDQNPMTTMLQNLQMSPEMLQALQAQTPELTQAPKPVKKTSSKKKQSTNVVEQNPMASLLQNIQMNPQMMQAMIGQMQQPTTGNSTKPSLNMNDILKSLSPELLQSINPNIIQSMLPNIVPNNTNNNNNNGMPSVYDSSEAPPERPTERAKNSVVKEDKKEKQGHMIYTAFNDKLFEFIRMLSVKLPHNKKVYDLMEKTMRVYIDQDITKPMEIWTESTAGYEEYLRECTPESVQKFLEVAPKIPILTTLEIKENWHYFKPKDVKVLWDMFGELLTIAEMTSIVPVGLMSAVQKMTLEMEKKGQLREFDGGKIDMARAIDLIMTVATQNDEVREGMQKLSQQLDGGSTAPAPPPSYLNLLQKMGNLQ